MLFRVRPKGFDRIQFWGVGGEVFHIEIRCAGQIRLHEGRAMRLESIPEQDNRPAEVPPQLSQHGDDDAVVNCAVRPQAVVAAESASVRGNGDHPDCREPPMVLKLVPKYRRLSARRPGALNGREHQKAGFVPENDHRALLMRFFLMRGQSHCSQCSISASFRSRARHSGLWNVKLSSFSNVGI